MDKEKTIERDLYGHVIALSPTAARQFFGVRDDAEVIDDGPVDDRPHLPAARKYRVRLIRS